MQPWFFVLFLLLPGAFSLASKKDQSLEVAVVQSDGATKLMRREAPDTNVRSSANMQRGANGTELPTTALCIAGQPRGLVEGQAENLQRNLISALGNVAVFVAGPPYPGLQPQEMGRLLEPLGAYESRIVEQPRVEELWRSVYENAPEADFKEVELFGDSGGATLYGPVFGNGQTVFQWYWRDQCLQMIEAAEKQRLPHDSHESRNFTKVVVTRFDYKWLAPHPPISMLGTEAADVWTPAGVEESGLNDHHAVLSRSAANVWLGVWRSLLNGQTAELLRTSEVKKSWRNSEFYLKSLAAKNGLMVKQFPPAAAVRSCPRGGAFTCKYEFCPQDEGTLMEFKDCEEGRFARRTAARLNQSGWTPYILARPWDGR